MKNKAAQQLGRLGGKVSSEAKAAAARKNGAKGGRPVKYGKAIVGGVEYRLRPASNGTHDIVSGDYGAGKIEREAISGDRKHAMSVFREFVAAL